ncbi:MAG: S49 family peptidase [Gammaproteobacteria bacterium]
MQDLNQNDVTNNLVRDLLREKRADRRWKNIRFLFWIVLIACVIYGIFHAVSGNKSTSGKGGNKQAALIRLDGMIAPGREFSAETVVPVLKDAFEDKQTVGVIIDINSPGGTPVQASIIHDAIVTMKKRYHKKVVVVGEDLLTSGAYYVAVAADQIYVNPSTLTGSIGVIIKGFGFTDVMKKIGIERRVYTAGTDKDRLDPFLPQTPEDMKKIQEVMGEVHKNFEQAVLDGRKGRLHVADPNTLFTGDFWSGQSALSLGLVDGLGNLSDVMEKEFGTSHFKEFGSRTNVFKMLGGQLGSAFDTMIYAL